MTERLSKRDLSKNNMTPNLSLVCPLSVVYFLINTKEELKCARKQKYVMILVDFGSMIVMWIAV